MKRLLSLFATLILISSCGVDAHCPCVADNVQSTITNQKDTNYIIQFKTYNGFWFEIASKNKYNIGDTIK